jgi:serine protease Do
MSGPIELTIRRARAFAVIATVALTGSALAVPAFARGPENIADVAEKVIDAVVNISTTQNVAARGGGSPERNATPQLPPDSPFQEFFDEFFKNRRQGENGAPPRGGNSGPRRVNSLGSGFIIDTAGIAVTNNHVIADADEVNIILNDGTKIPAEVVGRDKKTDLALLKFKPPEKELKAVQFGDSDTLRLGEWVVAIGNPFSLGGTVTAGIVSARNRDISSGPYDNYIQTDAAINRGNSGGPLFNLNGEVVGVNTAIYSPTGGSVGIGFAVPSKMVVAVIDQLRQFGEARRGWLGVSIQEVTDEIGESLNVKPARGALVGKIDDKGPAKPAGIESGDVIVKFDGKDIKVMKDLPRIVADTPVGKEVDVVLIRKGKEQIKKVVLGRLEDEEKLKEASLKSATPPEEKTVTQKALGLDLAALSPQLRTRYKVKETVKGVVITSVEGNRDAADKRLSPGDVIMEVAQEVVANPADIKKRVDQLKKDGKKTALLTVSNPDGEVRFVTLSVQ